MKCPYCAEEIKAEAVLCRFCGARRFEGTWLAPGDPRRGPKSNFTIVSSGWLLILSGIASLLSLTSPVPVLGSLRHGLWAFAYNATFAGLFGAMGFALVRRKPWALPITLATSLAYTLDKLLLLLDDEAAKDALGEIGGALGDLGPVVQQALTLLSAVFLLLWWSFVAYLYVKRAYFQPRPMDPQP